MLREVETLVNIMQTIMSIYVNRFRKVPWDVNINNRILILWFIRTLKIAISAEKFHFSALFIFFCNAG